MERQWPDEAARRLPHYRTMRSAPVDMGAQNTNRRFPLACPLLLHGPDLLERSRGEAHAVREPLRQSLYFAPEDIELTANEALPKLRP